MSRGAWIGGALAAALVVLVVFGRGDAGARERPLDPSNRGPEGRRGAAAFLAALGRDVEPWRDPPRRLADVPRGGLLWTSVAPLPLVDDDGEPRRADGEEDGAARGVRRRLHDPYGYRDFVELGGVLVLPAVDALESFVAEDLELEEVGRLLRGRQRGTVGRSRVRVGDGPWLEVEAGPGAFLPPTRAALALEPVAADADGRVLVAAVPLGAGRLVLLGAPSLFDNEALGRADHGALLAGIVDHVAPEGPVRLDRYALGGWRREGALDLALGPRFLAFALALASFAALAAWRVAWVGAFPRDPRPLEVVSPLARARARAGLLRRARRVDLLGGLLVRLGLADVARRAGVPVPRAPLGTGGGADEGRSPASLRAESETLLGALAARADAADRLPRWRRALTARPARRSADLERIDATLDELERSVHARAPGTVRG